MKKKFLIPIFIIAVILVIFLCLQVAKHYFENNPGKELFVFSGFVSKDDGFEGPPAGANESDRDGTFRSLAVSSSNPDIIFVGTENNALFKSTDGGKEWKWIRNGFWHDQRSYPEFYDILIDPADENLMYAVLTNGPQTPDIERAAGFYFSLDGGENWQRSIDGLPNTATTSIAISVLNGRTRLLVGLDGENPTNSKMEGKNVQDIGGIYISDDRGKSWKVASIPKKGMNNRYSYIASRGSIIYASGHRFTDEIPGTQRDVDLEKAIGLIKSEDGGETWKIISPPNTFCYYFDASADGKTLYFNNNKGKPFKSIDGGKSWKELAIYFSNIVKVSPYNSNTVIFANGNQLFKSEDEMETHKKVFEVFDGGFDDIEFTSNPEIIYASGAGYRVYKSTDGGDSFSQIANLRDFIEMQ